MANPLLKVENESEQNKILKTKKSFKSVFFEEKIRILGDIKCQHIHQVYIKA